MDDLRNFTLIQGDKPEKKPVDLGPRPDHRRTYEEALASERLFKKLSNLGPAEDLARNYWAGCSSAPPSARQE
jgi:hypothetical protein